MEGNTWPRDRYTGVGGGLYTGVGGGLYTGPGGGLYTGACDRHYRSNWPPIHILVRYMLTHGYQHQSETIARAHQIRL